MKLNTLILLFALIINALCNVFKTKNQNKYEEISSIKEEIGLRKYNEKNKKYSKEDKPKDNISHNKIFEIKAPYQDNEDFIIAPMGIVTPDNVFPLQIDTTSYKSWVSSSSKKDGSFLFGYDKEDSETVVESGEWDTVVDEEGTISGDVLYDNIFLGRFEINHFKFIEAIEYEDEFNDYKYGKLGFGNCQYANSNELEYCLLQKLKDNNSIEKRIFSLREYNNTHGEIIIGDANSNSKNNNYPILKVVGKDIYEYIKDDEFKMSWITKISHVIFKNNSKENKKNIFNNNMHISNGFASFDSSCHYIEAPTFYINQFQEKMFDLYYPNVCRKVNDNGIYMFLCNKERFLKIKNNNKDLSFIIIMNGYGFEIPMNSLFEQTRENDYEFFIHFKDYEQNIWNLGHPFFHLFTIIFDQDNQEIGIEGKNIYFLKDETEKELKNIGLFRWFKIILMIFISLLLLTGICLILRFYGIKHRINNGVNINLVDNENIPDFDNLTAGTNLT